MWHSGVVGLVAAGLLLAAPARAGEAIQLRGVGAQVYTCEAAANGFAWRLKAPDARLIDDGGKDFGHHFAGPSWQAQDGSTVVGEVITSSTSPRAGSIPWLLLRAKSHSGDGVFASIGFIVRIQTEGGVAPATGCDADHAGTETRVPYNAIYVFFS
jgi:hypothetical protein